MLTKFTAACAALLCFSSLAQAAKYEFSYNFLSGDLITGSFEGTLAPDGNTIDITSTDGFIERNGTALGGFNLVVGTIADPFALLDGSAAEFSLVNSGGNGMLISSSLNYAVYDVPGTAALVDFPINASGFSVTAADSSAVPLPGGLPLAMAGVGGLALLRRRAA